MSALTLHRTLAALVLAGTGMALASPLGGTLGVINESPSLPRGLYLRAPGAQPTVGAIVAIAPPPAAQAYLKQLGAPPDILLLKRVAAAGGDLVCARGGEVTAGRRVVTARGSDRRGRPLPSWRGCVRLKPHEIFLLGDTEASFDGRYFGPVSTREVAGVFTEAFTW